MPEQLSEQIKGLKRSAVRKKVAQRMREFKKLGKCSISRLFEELCFCILTANFNAERSIAMQNKLRNAFVSLGEQELAAKLKSLGHRFPNTRAAYIVEARKHKKLLKALSKVKKDNKARDLLVRNVKGIGYKEASHFLRNIGFTNLAIIDFHIVDLLVRNRIIKRPKTITKKVYIEVERKLRALASKLKLSLAELDLYMWYLETGKVLK